MTEKRKFFIGGYAQNSGDMAGRDEGIYQCEIDLNTGAFGPLNCVADCLNPSYLAWGPDRKQHGKNLYAVREVLAAQNPALLSFEVLQSGKLQPVNSREIDGEAPCHLAVDLTGRFIASAHYMSGDFEVFGLQQNGAIGPVLMSHKHAGSGPNLARQAGPHAHFVGFLQAPDQIVVIDLGLDRIFAYPFDPAAGVVDVKNPVEVSLPAGVGPRHLIVTEDGRSVLIFCEMQERILFYTRSNAFWDLRADLMVFDPPGKGDGSGAAIRLSPDQRHVYVSSRLSNEIACFALNSSAGTVTLVQRISSGGDGPRDFSITPDGAFIVVANQNSNTLCSLKIERQSGAMAATGHSVTVGAPTCVLF